MRTRVHYDDDAQPNMGDDRRTSVWVDFTVDEGLSIDGYDSASWPSSDYEWHIRVGADQAEKLRESLEAQASQDTLDAVVSRFENVDYRDWLGINNWLEEHGIEYSFSSRTSDN